MTQIPEDIMDAAEAIHINYVMPDPTEVRMAIAEAILAERNRALSTLPIAVEGKVEWESPEEWEIEQRSFHAVGRDDVPVDVQQLVAKLWAMYCHAASPSSPGKDGGQEDDRTEGFIAGYDEGLRQSKNEASISTTDALEKAKAVLKTIRRGALAPMGDVIAALTALDNALEAAPSKETDQ